jgi:hypothetical protein
MAWGYGRVGYGPFRVRRVLAPVPDPGERLQAAAGELARGGPTAAYALLGDSGVPRLPGPGPAFGTKFLYFCSPPGDRTALILDRLVAARQHRPAAQRGPLVCADLPALPGGHVPLGSRDGRHR